MPSLVSCFCQAYKCKGTLISPSTKRTHDRADLRLKTIASQTLHRGIILPHAPSKPSPGPSLVKPYLTREPIIPPVFDFPDPVPTSPCAVEQQMLDHGTLTQEDIDLQTHGTSLPNLGPNFHTPEALLDAVNYYSTCNALSSVGARPLTSYVAYTVPDDLEHRQLEKELDRAAQCFTRDTNDMNDMNDQAEDQEDPSFGDDDQEELEEQQLDDETLISLANDSSDSVPDPFQPAWTLSHSRSPFISDTALPPHLLVIYATVTWLHLQWHLPRAACNALLSILACLLLVLAPQLKIPFITLRSATNALRLDPPLSLLPVCPQCLDVFPAAGSLHTQDSCLACSVDLFLHDKTKRGKDRANKIPFVKYPYLSLSQQIQSLLAIPGLEKTLDEWRGKLRTQGQYQDIFDGDMCRSKLKDPDGKVFFSNSTSETNGPNGEL